MPSCRNGNLKVPAGGGILFGMSFTSANATASLPPTVNRPPRHYNLIVAGIFCLAGFLAFANLDNTPFWDDEAQVGIIARNLLEHGELTGWDGRNLYAYRNGTLLDRNLNVNNPPLQYYICAFAFDLFGVSTTAGRLPFVVLGLLALLALFLLLRLCFRRQPLFHLYALAAFAFSMPFILNIRQCRYYSLSMLSALLAFYFHRRLLRSRRWRDFLACTLCLIALFYGNYLLFAGFAAAMLVVHLLFHRTRLKRQELAKICACSAIFLLATLPFAISNTIWHRPDMASAPATLSERFILFWWHLRDLNRITVLPWMLLAAALVSQRFIRMRGMKLAWREWMTLGLSYVAALTILSPQPVAGATDADVRYLVPVYPLFIACGALVFWFIHRRWRRGWMLATALLAASLCSSIFTLAPRNLKPRWLLPAYIYEISHEFVTPVSATVEYLRQHAALDERVTTVPEFYNYPLMFYLGDRIRLSGTLTYETPLDRNRIRGLSPHQFVEETFPDWLISFGGQKSALDLLRFYSREHVEEGRQVRHRYELVERLPVYFWDTSRPELIWHTFGTKGEFDGASEGVYVFRRREK